MKEKKCPFNRKHPCWPVPGGRRGEAAQAPWELPRPGGGGVVPAPPRPAFNSPGGSSFLGEGPAGLVRTRPVTGGVTDGVLRPGGEAGGGHRVFGSARREVGGARACARGSFQDAEAGPGRLRAGGGPKVGRAQAPGQRDPPSRGRGPGIPGEGQGAVPWDLRQMLCGPGPFASTADRDLVFFSFLVPF